MKDSPRARGLLTISFFAFFTVIVLIGWIGWLPVVERQLIRASEWCRHGTAPARTLLIVLGSVVVTAGFFKLRESARIIYGALECGLSVALFHESIATGKVFLFLGAVYIGIRGIDNMKSDWRHVLQLAKDPGPVKDPGWGFVLKLMLIFAVVEIVAGWGMMSLAGRWGLLPTKNVSDAGVRDLGLE